MTEQARTSRVLIGLIVSMTIGAVVLMALDNGAVPMGAFSLARLLENGSAEKVAVDGLGSGRDAWNRIEVFYSGTTHGNVRELALLNGLDSGHDLNAHFVICNGVPENEGKIETTQRWMQQRPCLSDENWRGSIDTIRICVVADELRQKPSEIQKAMAEKLVNALCKEFRVNRRQVALPANWRI